MVSVILKSMYGLNRQQRLPLTLETWLSAMILRPTWFSTCQQRVLLK